MSSLLHPVTPLPCTSTGPVVHSLNEFVLPELVTSDCVQSEVLLASNTSEPGRPSRPTWYVPVRGAMTVISNEPEGFDLKKTSLVETSTPTAGLSLGAKGARATTSHGGGGKGDGGGGEGEGGGGDGDGGGDGSGDGGDDGGCDGGIGGDGGCDGGSNGSGGDGGCDGDGDGSGGGGDDGGCDGDGDAAGPKSRTAA